MTPTRGTPVPAAVAAGLMILLAAALPGRAAPAEPAAPKPGGPAAKPPARKPPVPPPGAATPADDPLKTAFEALPEADRRAVQEALIWVGDYASVVNGAFGPRTRDALGAYARTAGLPPASLIEPEGRARLFAAAKAARDAVGFAPVREKRSGLVLALPQKLVPKRTATDTGTRYASADGALVVDTLSRPAGEANLGDVFARMTAAGPDRTITYKLLKPDFFVVTGDTGERRFYSRFALGPADGKTPPEVRGFTLAYPKADTKRMDRITLAVAASFDPFPGSAAPLAAPKPVATPKPVAAAPAQPFLGQALMVAPGLALTVLTPKSCPSPQAGGTAVSFKSSDGSGLSLLAVPGRDGRAPRLADGGYKGEAQAFTLFSLAADTLDVAPAVLRAEGGSGAMVMSAPLQRGAEGAVVIDRGGRLIGLARPRAIPAPRIGGIAVAADYRVAGGADIRAVLDKAGLRGTSAEAGDAGTLGAAVASWRPALFAVTCAAAVP